MLLHANLYWKEEIATMVWPYVLNFFSKQLNVLKVDDYGIIPMEKFELTTIDITLKNHHTW